MDGESVPVPDQALDGRTRQTDDAQPYRGSGNGIARLGRGSGDSVVRLENFSQCNGGSLLNDIGDSFEDMELRSRLGE